MARLKITPPDWEQTYTIAATQSLEVHIYVLVLHAKVVEYGIVKFLGLW